MLRVDQWERIDDFLMGKASDCGETAMDNRLFFVAVLWITRRHPLGETYRKRFGHWHRVYVRYDRWSKKGVWARLAESVADPDFEQLFVDGSIVRVHQHGAGEKKSAMHKPSDAAEAVLTTKIHAAVNALGNLARLLLTAGQASEYGHENALIEGFKAQYIVADKGYDSNEFVETIGALGAEAVIPPRSNRKTPREYDKHIYKERNLVERFFQKIKNFRRIATRYERLAQNYLSILQLAATMIWLK